LDIKKPSALKKWFSKLWPSSDSETTLVRESTSSRGSSIPSYAEYPLLSNILIRNRSHKRPLQILQSPTFATSQESIQSNHTAGEKLDVNELDPRDISYCLEWDQDVSKLRGKPYPPYSYYTGELQDDYPRTDPAIEAYHFFITYYNVNLLPVGTSRGDCYCDNNRYGLSMSKRLPMESVYLKHDYGSFIDYLFHLEYDRVINL
jgi:hypothetical protein